MTADNVHAIADRLPRVTPGAAALSRIAFDARFRRFLAVQARSPDLAVLRRLPPDEGMLLEIEAGDGRVRLALDTRELPALDMALALADEDDACAVASAVLTPLLNLLGSSFAAPRVVHRSRCSLDRHAEACPVIAANGVRVAVVQAEAALVAALGERLRRLCAEPSAALAGLLLQPRLSLMRRVLPMTTLAGLKAGDVMLLDLPRDGMPAFTFLLGKGLTMQANATLDPESGGLVATENPTLAPEDAMPDDATLLDELQVPVSFEVDTARIGLAELASIRAGYVIELDRALDAAEVRLICHGQTVGHGQLVAIGERMGVRIVRMGLNLPAREQAQ